MSHPTPGPNSSSLAQWEYLVMGGCMALLAAITVPGLGRQGFWLDEVFSVETAANGSALREVLLHSENNMALYYALLCGWLQLGSGEAWTRLLSVGFALLTIPVVHLVARRLFDRPTALIADVLLVANSCFVFYAVEARSYSLVVLLGALATWAWLHAVDRPSWRAWLGYAVVVAAGVYAHYLALFIVVAHGVTLVLPPRERVPVKFLMGAAVAGVVLVSPLALFRPALSAGQVDWLSRPGAAELVHVYTELAGGRTLAIGGLLAALWLFWFRLSPGVGAQPSRAGVNVVLAWLLVPTALGFLVSITLKPLFLARYFILSVPAAALLLAVVMARWRGAWRFGAVAAVLVWSTIKIVRTPAAHGAAWREVAALISGQAGPNEVILCYPFHFSKPLAYYLRQAGAASPTNLASGPYNPGGGSVDPDPALDRLRALAASADRIWLVSRPIFQHRLNRGWTPQIVATIETSLPARRVIPYKDPRNQEPMELIIFERAAASAPPANLATVKE